jgi:hypothetical protein
MKRPRLFSVPPERVEQANQLFRAALTDPNVWRDKANDLLNAVACLTPRIEAAWQAHAEGRPLTKRFDDVYGCYFMLVAFALENLAKAVIVHRRRDEWSPETTELPACLKTHRLPDLLGEIGLTWDQWYLGVLERLTRAVTWAGRYPVPSKAHQLNRAHELGLMLGVYSADDLRDLQRLVAAVQRIVSRELGEEPSHADNS